MVGDAALLVLSHTKRAVVRPRHPRVVLVLCGADVYQSSVERRQARVADVIPVRIVLHVDRSGDGERDYETFTGQTRRGLHHTQLGVSTSVLSHQGPGLTDSLVSLVL